VYFVSNTLIGIILYIRVVKIYKPNNKIDTESISYGKHLSFLGIIGSIVDNIDSILIFHFIGPVQLAIYNFAVAIPSQIKGPMKGLAGLILPKFVERSDEEIRTGMRNKVLVLFICVSIIIGVYIIIAPYIYQIFFPKYLDSIKYSRIFSFSLLSIIAIPADTYFTAKQKIKYQYVAIIGGFIIQISVLSIGLFWGGLIGLVVAYTITKLLWGIQSVILYEWSSRNIRNITK
jgi:O-antigen/teichoic acid export membrane protein